MCIRDSLTADTQQISQRRQNGNHSRGLSGGGWNKEVNQCLYCLLYTAPRPGQLLYSTHPPHRETGHPPNQNKHNHVYLIYYIKTGQENIVSVSYTHLVNKTLEEKMAAAFSDVWETARTNKVSLRRAAYLIAVKKVIDTKKLRGIWP